MIVGHCTVCGRAVLSPGKLRGFRLAAHTCVCGGALTRGRGRSEAGLPEVYAVPLRPEQAHAADRARTPRGRPPFPRGFTTPAVLLALAGVLVVLLLGTATSVAAYHLGQADGRTDLYASIEATRQTLDTLTPKVAATTRACLALQPRPLRRAR